MTLIPRRQFLAFSVGAGIGCLQPAASLAQPADQKAKKRVVRATIPSADPNAAQQIRKAWASMLLPHGFIDGENIEIEVVQPQTVQLDQNHEYDAIVQRVLRSRPDVIVMHMGWLPHFARFTREVPLVFSGFIEPEDQAFIETVRRPGGNVTGVVYPLFELQAKRIGMVKEMMPEARRAAVVCGTGGILDRIERNIKVTAKSLGMEGFVIALPDLEKKGRVTQALQDGRIDIVDFIDNRVHPDTPTDMMRMGVAGTAGNGRDDDGMDGILVSYDAIEIEQVAAELAARILRGEKVSTLPAREPQKFWTSINLRTARALGIRVPASILIRADRVFE